MDLFEDSALENQRKVENVSLITDGSCGHTVHTRYFFDLVRFENLKRLEWKGLQRYDDFKAIQILIETRGKQIQRLVLDLVSWIRAKKTWEHTYRQLNRGNQHKPRPKNFFASAVLNILPGVKAESLMRLTYLSLSSVSFHHEGVEMARVLNIARLQTLKLWNCPGSLILLDLLIESTEEMSLKVFEFSFDAVHVNMIEDLVNPTHPVTKFIRLLRGLTDLFLMLPESVDWNEVSSAILKHSSSLQRLVVHQLEDRGDDLVYDGHIDWSSRWGEILQAGPLQCFGTSMMPRLLVKLIINTLVPCIR